MEGLINEALSKFRLAGNYFRITSEGGVLEAPAIPLELGESYWLVTQRALREPVPESLQIEERRCDRGWLAYRISLPLLAPIGFEALKDLSAFLQRDVIRALPKVNLLWPTPSQIDIDGTPIFDISVVEMLVRSVVGIPQCVLREQPVVGEEVDKNLYLFRFEGKEGEAAIGVPGGTWRRLRFDRCDLLKPAGVFIYFGDHELPAFDPRVGDMLSEVSAVRVEVPSHRLWRNVRVNGAPLRPLPDGTEWAFNGQLLSFRAGSFGDAIGAPAVCNEFANLNWYGSIEELVLQMAGKHAVQRLRHLQTKGQLLRWASDYDAQALLPKLLSLMSSGVSRGVS